MTPKAYRSGDWLFTQSLVLRIPDIAAMCIVELAHGDTQLLVVLSNGVTLKGLVCRAEFHQHASEELRDIIALLKEEAKP